MNNLSSDISLILNSAVLGAGLAMDAFSVSLADGLNEPGMKRKRKIAVAGVFAFFQALMPLLGWLCIHTVAERFIAFEKAVPYIALVLLAYIGGKMLYGGIRKKEEEGTSGPVTFVTLLTQGIATSIDALSAGFTIAGYGFTQALTSALIISAVTYMICRPGLYLGTKAGTKLSWKAQILGGLILIGIGLEIFIKGILK